jgi:hypothetical protein
MLRDCAGIADHSFVCDSCDKDGLAVFDIVVVGGGWEWFFNECAK